MGEVLSGHDEPSEEKKPEEIKSQEQEREAIKRYDALVVFGFGARSRTKEEVANDPDRLQDSGWHLTVGTKARVLAAGELWKMGEVDKIIFSEGSAPNKEKSGAQLMREYLLAKYPEIPEEKVILEDKAANTIENFAGVVDYLDRSGLTGSKKGDGEKKIAKPSSNIAFLSNRFHLARIQQIAEKFGLKGDGFSAEDVLALAAASREQETGKKTIDRFNLWQTRMSTPEGNEAWRDPNEVAHREYLTFLRELITKAEVDQNQEKREKYLSLIAKSWNPKLRDELDSQLVSEGIDVEPVHKKVDERLKQLGATSYKDYLRQENRWSGGMEHFPEYWIFQAAKVSNERFRKILQDPKNSDAVGEITNLGFTNPLEMNDEEFERMRRSISSPEFINSHRKLPPEDWESETPKY